MRTDARQDSNKLVHRTVARLHAPAGAIGCSAAMSSTSNSLPVSGSITLLLCLCIEAKNKGGLASPADSSGFTWTSGRVHLRHNTVIIAPA